MTPDAATTPSKSAFPGDRKTRNAAHSRVYRLLKKNHTGALADEVAELQAEVDALVAAHALSSSASSGEAAAIASRYSTLAAAGVTTASVEAPDGGGASFTWHLLLPGDGKRGVVQDERTRKAKKALAAKAARKRTRERLSSLEQQVAGLQHCLAELKALRSDTPPSGSAAEPSTANTLPPKKRHRSSASKAELTAVVIEDID